MIFNRRRFLLWFLGSAIVVVLVITASRNSSDSFSKENAQRKKNKNNNNGLYDENDVAVHLRSNQRQAEYIDKKGVHVVVGKYVGDSLQSIQANLSWSEINTNRHRPENGAGDDGEPVYLRPSEEHLSKRLWHINKFNVVVSDKIALNRSLPDMRNPACKKLDDDNNEDLPHASIVIIFHNEAWSTLLRTVHSVIDRSPRHLLKEFILVDDSSNRTFLGKALENHLTTLPVPARLIRTGERIGLIRARLSGASVAKGKVLLFLDAHCEVTQGWLQPLLSRIKESRTSLVCPIIDILNDDTFAYTKAFSMHWGAFNWALHFRWFTMDKGSIDGYTKDVTLPYRTPTMAGGLFAVDRNYFYELGSYDENMDIWGGENLELSFRAWMCGGSVEIAPCSRVGHVFRKASPYAFPREGGVGAVLHANLARVALVWMDEMAQFYFRLNADAGRQAKTKTVKEGVDARRELRKKLQCKSFAWYLENVWPQNFFPTSGKEAGFLRHKTSGLCLHRNSGASNGGVLGGTVSSGSSAAVLKDCVDERDYLVNQLFVMTTEGKKEGYVMTDEGMCLDSPNAQHTDEASVRFQACTESERQMWRKEGELTSSSSAVVHVGTGKCLSHPTGGTSDVLTLRKCSGANEQDWLFETIKWREEGKEL